MVSKSRQSGRQGPIKPTRKSRIGRGHRLPLGFFVSWLICEFAPALIPSSASDDLYWTLYYYSEDLSTILLALACYTALSYTSTVLKGISLSVVVVACGLLLFNILINIFEFPKVPATAMMIVFILLSLQLFMARFIFRLDPSRSVPDLNHIYLVVTKPHNLWGMAGLFWSGVGGGFSVYADGWCYWFSREAGVMVKEYDPDYYKGRRLIDCGVVTADKIDDIDDLVGTKWSIWNNCFTVFGRWRRIWSGEQK